MPDIKPFVLFALPEHEAHLCPVRALAEWLAEAKLSGGYIFRKIASGDRVSESNRPMVCIFTKCNNRLPAKGMDRLLINSWNCSETTFWMLVLILIHMELTLSVVEDASIFLLSVGGQFVESVSGEDGVLSSQA